MTELELDPMTWFAERELSYKPRHFIVARTPLTSESRKWIHDKLRGRFAVVNVVHNTNLTDDMDMFGGYPAFEDPGEATFYELTWS